MKKKVVTILLVLAVLTIGITSYAFLAGKDDKSRKNVEITNTDITQSEAKEQQDTSPNISEQPEVQTDNNGDDNEESVVGISDVLIERLSISDLKQRATLVTHCKVVEISDPFKIRSVTGGIGVFIDYNVEVYSVYRGEANPNDIVTVRVEGGYEKFTNMPNMSAEEPILVQDRDYLLFLYQTGMGGGFQTKGDYYQINGTVQGIFEADGEKASNSHYSEQINLNTFKAEMKAYNEENPVDKDYFRKDFIENCQKNIASGFITEEEYESYLKDRNEYATIIE